MFCGLAQGYQHRAVGFSQGMIVLAYVLPDERTTHVLTLYTQKLCRLVSLSGHTCLYQFLCILFRGICRTVKSGILVITAGISAKISFSNVKQGQAVVGPIGSSYAKRSGY